ncbi:MAG: hypothetical protein KDD47_21640, partial [Acidobacteria bacterium]|nr:hypothetical protein [Acidobacteriota bacterium]
MIRRPRPLGALLSLLFLLSPFVPTDVSAQPVELAADLIPGLPAAGFLSTPRSYGTFGDRAVFETFDGLWISDGTATGTYPLGSSCSICREDPRFFKASSSRLYWLAAAPLGERLLWSSDGSPRGAAPVDVMATFEAGVRPEALFVSGDAIYFSAFREPSHGIFRYRPGDGEPLRLVTSLASRFFASLGEFAELGGRVYFFAADETGSPGFWRTDGTVAGSVRLFDFGHGSQQDPFGLTRVGDRLYFFASLGGGIDLWVSDGSGAPPQRLTDFRDFSTLPHNGKVLPWAGGACFLGEQPNGAFGLWTTDGTAEGTEPLTNFSSTGGIPSFFGGDVLAVVGDSVLFAARANSGREVTLFRVEAGVPGVQQVVAGDRAPVLPTNDFGFRVANGRAYFPVEDASVQRALWFSDGTDAGTQSIETVCGTACGGILQAVERFDETLLFLRGSGAGPTSLWRTDGTPGGSRQLLGEAFHDFPPQLFSSWIGRVADGYLLPTELPGQGRVLAKVEDDGTAAVAWPLERFPEGSTPTDLEPFGQELAFVAQRPIDFVFQRGLFAISPESLEVRDLLEGSAWDPFDRPGDVVGFGDHLSFRSDRFEDLWVTDGTPEGTLQLWQAELFNQRLIFQTPFLDELLFGFSVEPSGCEIWQSDGSAAGTRRLLELAAESCGLGFPKALGNAVYFWLLTSGDPERQSVVRFRPDTGEMRAITPARNVSLVTFDPDPGFRELGGEIYFFFDDGLWKVGASAAAAVPIAGLGDPSAKSAFAELGGQLFLLTRE